MAEYTLTCLKCGGNYTSPNPDPRRRFCRRCGRLNPVCPICLGDDGVIEVGEDVDGNTSYACHDCMVMFTIHGKEFGEPD